MTKVPYPWWDAAHWSDWLKGALVSTGSLAVWESTRGFLKKMNKRRKDKPKEAEQLNNGPFRKRRK